MNPLIVTREEVRRVLDMPSCIDAVEEVMRAHARRETIAPGILGAHVTGGGFHVKTAGMSGANGKFVAKVNGNFPGNPAMHGLPTIQGMLVLFDVTNGRVLAVMDSIEITSVRTAATSAVAARHLAARDASTLAIIGCGEQGRSHLRAMAAVRPITKVFAYDISVEKARAFQSEMQGETGISIDLMETLAECREADIVVTCTTAERWFLGRQHVRPGAFVAAVGADNPHKQELEPELLAASMVVTDSADQAATIGELRYALAQGLVSSAAARELSDVIEGRGAEVHTGGITVFDSTGTALQDLAASMRVYSQLAADSR